MSCFRHFQTGCGFQAERFEEAVQLGQAVDGCATVIAAGDAQIVVKDLTKR